MTPQLLVLYARSDALGDGLIRLPALRAARHAFPGARIVYATQRDSYLASTLRRHTAGLVDEFRPHRSLRQVVAELKPARGEAAVADFRQVAGWLVREWLGLLPSGIAYEPNFPGYVLSPTRGLGRRPHHSARRAHRLIERLAGRALPFEHRVEVLAAARAEVQRLRGGSARPLVVLAGNAAPHKALTAEQLAGVAEHLLQRDIDVMSFHSPGEGPTAERLAGLVPGMPALDDRSQRDGIPLLELFLALGEQAAAYVGPEGGLAHCVAAVGTPVVVVNYGASMTRWRPLSPRVEVVEARAASRGGRTVDVPAATIVQAVDRLLAARTAAPSTGTLPD